MKPVDADACSLCFHQPVFYLAKSRLIHINRHLQSVVELPEIRVLGNVAPVLSGVETAEPTLKKSE